MARLAHGDADAVSIGDFHLKNLVALAWPVNRGAHGGPKRLPARGAGTVEGLVDRR